MNLHQLLNKLYQLNEMKRRQEIERGRASLELIKRIQDVQVKIRSRRTSR